NDGGIFWKLGLIVFATGAVTEPNTKFSVDQHQLNEQSSPVAWIGKRQVDSQFRPPSLEPLLLKRVANRIDPFGRRKFGKRFTRHRKGSLHGSVPQSTHCE